MPQKGEVLLNEISKLRGEKRIHGSGGEKYYYGLKQAADELQECEKRLFELRKSQASRLAEATESDGNLDKAVKETEREIATEKEKLHELKLKVSAFRQGIEKRQREYDQWTIKRDRQDLEALAPRQLKAEKRLENAKRELADAEKEMVNIQSSRLSYLARIQRLEAKLNPRTPITEEERQAKIRETAYHRECEILWKRIDNDFLEFCRNTAHLSQEQKTKIYNQMRTGHDSLLSKYAREFGKPLQRPKSRPDFLKDMDVNQILGLNFEKACQLRDRAKSQIEVG